MKVLVGAASKHGSTEEIARAVGDALAERGLDVTVKPIEWITGVEGYDAVVLGSGVYAGRWLPAAKEFVGRNGAELRARDVWLFSSGPIGDPPKPDEVPADAAPMIAATGARDHRLLAGKLERKSLSFVERAMVKAFRAPYGDFRDWDAIRTWAEGIGSELDARTKSA
jgi:menaquinone-dependent protoporphyrinogen oxidase